MGNTAGAPVRTVYLSLGANLGMREQAIGRALKLIAASPGVRLERVSALYATEPVGYLEQPEFLNCAAVVTTTCDPHDLLSRLRAIERHLGRRSRTKWHEREIDIDIVLIDSPEAAPEVIDSPDLRVPHPEMHRRAFVLVPLAEIAPDAMNPLLARSVRDLLAGLEDASGVRRT
ncbi:MAG TPA: 2-amino-4-hydroxy-6-hydroxymethyldihydropteridine diphosphokinase [Candidatus Kapabacteria bacterium]|nr:2-amino-4-hydroxy-6-hydroxymethyldihydropteridine diphosphokinase [Candidatus Kapabacteria bacterium]